MFFSTELNNNDTREGGTFNGRYFTCEHKLPNDNKDELDDLLCVLSEQVGSLIRPKDNQPKPAWRYYEVVFVPSLGEDYDGEGYDDDYNYEEGDENGEYGDSGWGISGFGVWYRSTFVSQTCPEQFRIIPNTCRKHGPNMSQPRFNHFQKM